MGLSPRFAIKTPGFVESGSDQTPSTGNAIKLGKLYGDVGPFHCTVIWDFVDDDNNNAVGGACQFKRQGTDTWYNAPDFMLSMAESAIGGTTVKTFSTVIFGLQPNTTYDVRGTVTDADGGSVTNRTTEFTTRRIPRIPSDDGDAHVVTNGTELTTAYNNANGSEQIQLRFSGSPYTSPGLATRLQNGSYENPLYITTYPGDSKVTLDQISCQDSGNTHIWADNLTISNRIHSQTAGFGDGFIITRVDSTNNTTNKPLQILFSDVLITDTVAGRDDFDGGDVLEVASICNTLTVLFCHFEDGNDALSKGGSPDNHLHRNHCYLFVTMDNLGDDAWELDNQCQGAMVGYSICGPNLGKTGISYQGQLVGWAWIFHTQMTGLRYGLDLGTGPVNIKHQWKLEHDQALSWCVNNTWIVGTNSNNKGNVERFLLGVVENTAPDAAGAVFVNNAWRDPETIQDGLGGFAGVTIPGGSEFNLPHLIDGQLYDAPTADPFDGLTLAQLQTEGHDTNSSTTTLSSSVFENFPSDVDVGTASAMFPVASAAADGAGVTGSGVNGMEPFVGPYHGSTPDVGAFQRLIRFATGDRQTTGWSGAEIKQAFKLPSGYTIRDPSTAHDPQYTALGLPTKPPPYGYVRLLIDKDGPTTPTAALSIAFRRCTEGIVWDRYLSFLDAEHIKQKTMGRKWRLEGGDGNGYIRHGLGVSALTSGDNTLRLCGAIEDGGFAEVTWGILTSTLTTTPTLERDPWEVFYSLFSEWGEVETGTMETDAVFPLGM